MRCYYHPDPDGMASAYSVKKFFSTENIEFIRAKYESTYDFSTLQPNEKVVLVDFALSPQSFKELLQKTADVIWIDHHKRFMNPEYNEFKLIPGIRSLDDAACVLTWNYFFPTMKIPKAIELIGDFDAWHWKFKEETRYFLEATYLYDLSPNSGFWNDLFTIRHFMVRMIEQGHNVYQYKTKFCDRQISTIGQEVEFEGRTCFAINISGYDSEYFENLEKDYPIKIMYTDLGDKFSVQLRSKSVDVKEIAEKFGGGGHTGASGFRCVEKPWKFIRKLPKEEID